MHIAHTVANRGGAVLLVAHDLSLTAAHADRITLPHQGRNIATGIPWNALTEPTLTTTPRSSPRSARRGAPTPIPRRGGGQRTGLGQAPSRCPVGRTAAPVSESLA